MNSPSIPMDLLSFPLYGCRLIEAGAGTGKTYTIAQLYTRLVLGHGGAMRPLTPPEILVVTFSEAATLELRDRIRQRLRDAARSFRNAGKEPGDGPGDDPGDDPALQALRGEFPAAQRSHAAWSLERASEWMDEAAIFTIHGWCFRTIRRQAFESGMAFSQEILPDVSETLREAVRDYWRATYYGISTEAANELVLLFSGPDVLLQELRPLLAPGVQDIRYADRSVAIPEDPSVLLEEAVQETRRLKSLRQRVREQWRHDARVLRGILGDLRSYLNGTTFKGVKDDATFLGWLDELDGWSTDADDDADEPWILLKLNPESIRLKKGGIVPQHPFFDALREWRTAVDCRDSCRLVASLLRHAALHVKDRFEQSKRTRGLLDYDDMPVQLDRALHGDQGDRLAELIRERYPVALVDEFQDTDSVQYRIFDRIYGVSHNLGDRGLFLIGDPKQSIYRFRGADIFTYLRARNATDTRRHTLETNYRSTPEVIRAVNAVFSAADRHTQGAFLFGSGPAGAIPFLPARAHRDEPEEEFVVDGGPAPALTIWTTEGLTGDRDTISTGAFRTLAADRTAGEIARWLGDTTGATGFRERKTGRTRSILADDIAILVRNRMEADAMIEALSYHGLTGVYLSTRDSVFAAPEATDILTWVRAIATPEDDRLVRTAIGTATMNVPLSELEAIARDDRLREEQVRRFAYYHRRWREDGILPALRTLIHDYGVPSRLRKTSGGERALTNVLHIAEWLQQNDAAAHNEKELIHRLSAHINDPGEEHILRLESDAQCIRIVTIFKSKGLEYNVVMAPFISVPRSDDTRKKSASGCGRPVTWHDEESNCILELRSGDAPTAAEAHSKETLSEEMRFLYVTLTRARFALNCLLAPVRTGNSTTPDVHSTAIGYVLNGGSPFASGQEVYLKARELWSQVGEIRITAAPAPMQDDSGSSGGVEAAAPTSGREEVRTPQRFFREKWWIASYTALTAGAEAPEYSAQAIATEEWHESDPVSGVPDEPEEPETPGDGTIHQFPAGPRPGTFFHNLIEFMFEDREQRVSEIQRRCELHGWTQWVPVLERWSVRFFDTAFEVPGSSDPLVFGKLRHHQSEMEFYFETRNATTEKVDQLVRRYMYPGEPRPTIRPVILQGMLKGFIDSVFLHDGRYYLADWKSNRLGRDDRAYHPAAVQRMMLDKRYDLQASIYLVALHRHLAGRLADYRYERDIGGALYVFLRGIAADGSGLAALAPPRELVEALDQLFRGVGL